ncbi:MAG: ImmA/IrrE family metallo-endopeptidase [Acidobacteriia bacterium]|nr:ImmA/IrrE family metallo-endopeptidase [Terriglobia bacterium]
MAPKAKVWTHHSVLALAGNADPVDLVTEKARAIVMGAIEDGWSGPPYDPFALAEHLKIPVVARQDISEARTVPSKQGFVIEFNPNRPRNRVKYSICHEIAHTCFPDCAERVRNRLTHEKMTGDDWQLETLCNIAAAEMLMPIGSVSGLADEHLTIDAVLDSRKRHEVSAEAVLLRAVRLTSGQYSVFCASRRPGQGGPSDDYSIDYAVSSKSWSTGVIRPGMPLPKVSVVGECIAIGFTAKGYDEWALPFGRVRIECVGVPPYPNQIIPRVLGIVAPQRQVAVDHARITHLGGDATQPRGSGPRIIAQLVNDSAFTWGGGLSLAVRKKWPTAQQDFRSWAMNDRKNLRLGNLHFAPIDDTLGVASLIAQHGYGPSPKPRIRYTHLKTALEQLGALASQHHASVHIPRLGCGQAGGSWSIVSELIEDALCSRGVKVYVYDLPGVEVRQHPQGALAFNATGV